MDNPRPNSANGEDNNGIPDDLRCKRSDGKQWRCTAMSMPDKTVCEKHYIQAKKRAANSALRASIKKAKRKSLGDSESKDDELFDTPLVGEDNPVKKHKEKASKSQVQYSPETPVRNLTLQRDAEFDENWRSFKTPPPLSTMDSSRSQKSFDASAMTEYSDACTDSSEDAGGQICHQCRKSDKNGVIWCKKCDRRGFCENCVSTWFPDISLEEIEKVCPACRGICTCKVCLRGDNMVKVRIREIPVLDKLQYLYCVLSSVLPVVKQIHHEQCFEVELEKKLRGNDIDLVRAKLNADEQMCCNICRIPIIDYHRHCANCSYDLCLHCCQDLRELLAESQMGRRNQEKVSFFQRANQSRPRLNLSEKYPDWKANRDGSIPCPPKAYGGCNYSPLNLNRIFKMNWVTKLVKNVEEMVSGCKVYDAISLPKSEIGDFTLYQCAHREDSDDNFLYSVSSEDLKAKGISVFRKHWAKGEPVIVKQVFDRSSISNWDPKAIWRGIRETSDEKMKDENRMVKAVDCFNWTEVEIELGQFIEGYSKGRAHEDGSLQMLKLKDWPSPSASEEFLLYHRPEFITNLPLLEYIHSKLGLLNVAAKLPHYSLQNDAGPKIYISYGPSEDIGRGRSVTNLHIKMRDMVYLLVHTQEVKLKRFKGNESLDEQIGLDDGRPSHSSNGGHDMETSANMDEKIDNNTYFGEDNVIGSQEGETEDKISPKDNRPGIHWDVFRRQDAPKLIKYMKKYHKDLEKPDNVAHPLCDGTVFLNGHHLTNLKEEFGVEPWSFKQYRGQAVFVPAGCPFQVQNLQSNVQLGLDFLSPESVGEAARLAGEIRCLPNDHEAKLQVLEVGKISLYAASSAIKEVQKLVLDPKLGAEIGFEDPNLTAAVSDNLEKAASKQQEISCA